MEQINRSGHKKVAREWTKLISVYLHCGFTCQASPSSFFLFSLKQKNISQFHLFIPTAKTTNKAAYLYANWKWVFWNNTHMKKGSLHNKDMMQKYSHPPNAIRNVRTYLFRADFHYNFASCHQRNRKRFS